MTRSSGMPVHREGELEKWMMEGGKCLRLFAVGWHSSRHSFASGCIERPVMVLGMGAARMANFGGKKANVLDSQKLSWWSGFAAPLDDL